LPKDLVQAAALYRKAADQGDELAKTALAALPPAAPLASVAQPPSVSAAAPVPSGPRLALVIGNSAYRGSVPPLANPVNDARLVAAALRSAGFNVELVETPTGGA